MQLSSFVFTPLLSDAVALPERKANAQTPTVRELAWLVDGDRMDVQLLLARVGELVRERKWQLRSGETPQPSPPPLPPPSSIGTPPRS